MKQHITRFIFFLMSNIIIATLAFISTSDNTATAQTYGFTIKKDNSSGVMPIKEIELKSIELDNTVRLKKADGSISPIDVEEYIAGVLTGEMPQDAPVEALKAMAVAARTYTLYMCFVNRNKSYDITSDPNLSQAFIDKDAAINAWNESGAEKYEIMRSAVKKTEGEILVYNEKPICALYHASSYPCTESSENVFTEMLPYLTGKRSMENLSNTYMSQVKYTLDEFNSLLRLNKYPEVKEEGFGISTVLNNNKRCSYIIIEDSNISFTVSGRKVRGLFSLRSTSFQVSYKDGYIVFDVFGFGHGVGLSQNGAILMAQNGSAYFDILREYYSGCEFYKTIYK